MRKLHAVFILAFAALSAPQASHAQTYTQPQLNALITGLLPTNGRQQITAADLRAVLGPMATAIFQSTPPFNIPQNGWVPVASGTNTSAWSALASSGLIVGTTPISNDIPNGLLYDNSGVLGNLTTGASGVLITTAASIPTISQTLPIAVQDNITATGILTAGSTGAGFTLGFTTATLNGTLPLLNGGTNASLTASNGGIVYSTASALAILAGTGTGNQCLLSGTNTAPSWGSCNSGTVTTFSAGNLSPLFTTSVATATTTPALTFSLSTQSANLVFAGPTTGSAAGPTFRALVPADLPLGSSSAVGGLQCGSGTTCSGGVISVSGGSSTLVPPQGRLTLLSHTPVMTTTQANKTTIFYDTYEGGSTVPVYSGSADTLLTIGSNEISDAVPTSSTGVANASGVFDEWAVNVSGTLTICHATNGSGGGWASDTGGSNTARGTGYTQLDLSTRPYVTNKNSIAHCYNGSSDEGSITANEATYLGTFGTTASAGTTTWVFGGQSSTGTAALFYLWNQYNRQPVATAVSNSTTNWNYGTGTIRQPNATSATMRVTYVYGQSENPITTRYTIEVQDGTGSGVNDCMVGIGIDATNAFAAGAAVGVSGNENSIATYATVTGEYSGYPGVGLHFSQALENAPASSASCTFYGGTTTTQNALTAQLQM